MTERSRGQPETRPTGEPVRGETTAALVLAPDDSRTKVRARHELLDATEPGETHVIGVAYDDQFLDHVEEHDGLHPNSLTVISVGDSTDGLADVPYDAITVDPENATTIADHVLDRIDDVSECTAEPSETVLCFDSLTALIDDVGIERTFQCIDTLVTHIDGVRANFHLDPTAHPKRARLALTTLFDTVVESTSGETWNRPGPTAGWSPDR